MTLYQIPSSHLDWSNEKHGCHKSLVKTAKSSRRSSDLADIFKVAIVRIDEALVAGEFDSRLILQVHDEVLVEVPAAERDVVGPLVIDIMRNAAELDVPLEVNVSWGDTWAAAKG